MKKLECSPEMYFCFINLEKYLFITINIQFTIYNKYTIYCVPIWLKSKQEERYKYNVILKETYLFYSH